MKLWLVALVVVGALAIVGIPALAFSLAANDHPAGARATTTASADDAGPPPPWAHGHRKHHKADHEKGHPGKHAQHGIAMRGWAHCVARKAAAAPDATFNPEKACGTRPVPPGQLKKKSRTS